MSGLLEPPGAEPLRIYLLREGGAGEGRREVACQWESPEEEEKKEVGCQWESPAEQKRDAAVQVDLLMQQLSWTRTGAIGRRGGGVRLSPSESLQHFKCRSVCLLPFQLPFCPFWTVSVAGRETHTRCWA